MTAIAHTIPAAPAAPELIPVIERGPGLDGGRSESVKTMRGLLAGLALVVPFWGGVLGVIALVTH